MITEYLTLKNVYLYSYSWSEAWNSWRCSESFQKQKNNIKMSIKKLVKQCMQLMYVSSHYCWINHLHKKPFLLFSACLLATSLAESYLTKTTLKQCRISTEFASMSEWLWKKSNVLQYLVPTNTVEKVWLVGSIQQYKIS